MKKTLLFFAASLFFMYEGFTQAEFNTGALKITVDEYGEIELYTAEEVYMLDRASILVGTSPTAVFDYKNDADTEDPTTLVIPPTMSDYEIYGAYNNAYSGAPPDVIVKLNAYGWNDGGYVILKFTVFNNEANPMDATAGLDIIPYINEEWGYDSVSYDDIESVIRFHRGNATNMGMKLLSTTLSSLYSFEWYGGYSVDEDYWTWMNYGSIQPLYASNTGDGPVTITAQAPVSLAAGESFEVYYAMALGENKSAMLANIASAVEKYETLFTGVEENGPAGNALRLGQNYPNPFSGNTTISYRLPADGFVSLKVFNSIGQEVAILVNGERAAGNHTVEFNADGLNSGIYFCTLHFGGEVQTHKMFVGR